MSNYPDNQNRSISVDKAQRRVINMHPNFPSESSSYGGAKDYPPHVQRDYKIKNRKKLEDLKLRTFKDILSSFERNDFTAFE